MSRIDAIATTRANGQPSLRELWKWALGRFLPLPIEESEQEALIAACTTPAQLERLARLLATAPQAGLATLYARVDESDHSLAAWIEALDMFYRYLEASNRTTPLDRALGYLCCTAEVTSGEHFADAVESMLHQYGYEG